MSVYKQKGSKNRRHKFTFCGRQIRESTKQPDKRVAEQIETAHKAALAKSEVGIREKKPVPTLREFEPLAKSLRDRRWQDRRVHRQAPPSRTRHRQHQPATGRPAADAQVGGGMG